VRVTSSFSINAVPSEVLANASAVPATPSPDKNEIRRIEKFLRLNRFDDMRASSFRSSYCFRRNTKQFQSGLWLHSVHQEMKLYN
jgi:hypothetical protein